MLARAGATSHALAWRRRHAMREAGEPGDYEDNDERFRASAVLWPSSSGKAQGERVTHLPHEARRRIHSRLWRHAVTSF